MIRAWGHIFPGWRWLYALQSISDYPTGDWGFHTVQGGVDPGEFCFRPGGVGVVEARRDL